MTSTVLTAVLGLAFWAVAARTVDAETLGRDSALVAALMSLSAIAQLNGVAAVTRFLPRLGRRSHVYLERAYAAIVLASMLAAVAFVAVAPALIEALAVLSDGATIALLFVAGVVLWSIFAVQDAALAAVRHAGWVPVENGIYGVLKIAALVALVVVGAETPLLAAWVLPLVLIVPGVTRLLFGRALPRHVAGQPRHGGPRTTDGFDRRRLVAFLAQDYAANALYQLSLTALPLLVIGLLGPRENAWFAVGFSVISGLALLSHNAVTAFVVEGAFSRERLGELLPALLQRVLLPLAAGSLLLALAAPVVLVPFGGEYVAQSDMVLRLLAVANVFRMIVVLFEALCRLHGDGRRLLATNGGHLVLLVALTATLGPALGADGVAFAWLLSNATVACCCVPSLRRALRGAPAVAPAAA